MSATDALCVIVGATAGGFVGLAVGEKVVTMIGYDYKYPVNNFLAGMITFCSCISFMFIGAKMCSE